MKISHDRKKGKLWLSQETYIKKFLERFNMSKAKAVNSPLVRHFNITSKQYRMSEKEKEEMSKVSYVFVFGSLMYAIVCTRPNITHAVGVIN